MHCVDYRNEAAVGRAIRESGLSREHLYITTKWSLGSVQDAIAKSLSNVRFIVPFYVISLDAY
jgi:diketogulonate reductase-like aldo/keto reductase